MKKICVIGHFGDGQNLLNGQTIKTKIVTGELENHFGEDQVERIDTHGGAKVYLRLPFQIFRALVSCQNIIIFPAHNGVRIIVPLLTMINHLFKRKLHYVVIGGWLPDFLKDRLGLSRRLKTFDGIYVETQTMKQNLEKQGFTNLFVVPNCKELHILGENELVYSTSEPYKLCTFSRVMKEKGIEDAVNAVKVINDIYGRIVYELDIYGQVDSEQTEWFENLQKEFPSYIRYKGLVDFAQSTEVLKNYFALLFPTHFFTEGIPGTIVDAYSAGVPVISTRWESFDDVVEDGTTGIGYNFDDDKSLQNLLKEDIESPERLNEMKKHCLLKAKDFSVQIALNVLCNAIE